MLDLLRTEFCLFACTSTRDHVALWVAGSKAEKIVKKICDLSNQSRFDHRFQTLTLRGQPTCADHSTRATLLANLGVHTTSPLHGKPLLPYISDLELAIAASKGCRSDSIDAELRFLALQKQENSKLVEEFIQSIGLDLGIVKNTQRWSIRHYDVDSLRSSFKFVSDFAETLVDLDLLTVKDSANKLEIFDVASRHSVIRSDDIKLMSIAELKTGFEALASDRHSRQFTNIVSLQDILCFDVSSGPTLLNDVLTCLVESGVQNCNLGEVVYSLLLCVRECGPVFLRGAVSIASRPECPGAEPVVETSLMVLGRFLKRSFCAFGGPPPGAIQEALTNLDKFASLGHKYGFKGDSFCCLARSLVEDFRKSGMQLQGAIQEALTTLDKLASLGHKHGFKGNSFCSLARSLVRGFCKSGKPMPDAIDGALASLEQFASRSRMLDLPDSQSCCVWFHREIETSCSLGKPLPAAIEDVMSSIDSGRKRKTTMSETKRARAKRMRDEKKQMRAQAVEEAFAEGDALHRARLEAATPSQPPPPPPLPPSDAPPETSASGLGTNDLMVLILQTMGRQS